MIPFLIYIFLKKYSPKRINKDPQLSRLFSYRSHFIFMGLLIILLALIPIPSRSQNLQLNYKIKQGGDDIGWMRLEKNIEGNTTNLLMISEIKTRMIFRIRVSAKESSAFENGQLIYSSQFRKSNGNTKVDKQTKFAANKYEVRDAGEKKNLDYQFIGTNLLSLYFNEPVGINFVYCDNHECYTSIIRTDDGGYKVKFPDGNSNCYYYTGGTCTKVKIDHTFYTAYVILNP